MKVIGKSIISRVGEKTSHQDRFAAVCLASISIALLIVLTNDWQFATHDGPLHFHRVRAVADSLRAGVLYPRWFPDFTFGYGYPVLNYYPPAFYYPPALLHLTGIDVLMAVRFAMAAGFALSAWWMYRFARLYVSLWPAVVCVLCFQFYPYRMVDLFERGAFPEFAAFTWLPLLALYAVQAVAAHRPANSAPGAMQEDTELSPGAYRLPLVKAGLTFAALILTHSLTALMAVMVAAILLVLLAAFQTRERSAALRLQVKCAVMVVAIGTFLSAWFSLPVLLELNWVIIGHGFELSRWVDNFAGWPDLFEFNPFYSYDSLREPTLFLPIYVIPIVIAAPFVVVSAKTRALRLFTLVTFLATLIVFWLTTGASSWLWTSFEFLFEKLQCPWRWQLFVAFGTALLLAACLESLMRFRRLTPIATPLLGISLSAYIVAYAVVGLGYPFRGDAPRREFSAPALWQMNAQLWEFDSQGRRLGKWAREYLPVSVEVDLQEMAVPSQKPLAALAPIDSVTVVPTRLGLMRQQYQVDTQQPFRLLFHQFYFPPWRVFVNDVRADLAPAGGLAIASVEIPPGASKVDFSWGPTRAVWIGRLLTAIGWAIVFALLYREAVEFPTRRNKRHLKRPPVQHYWLLVAWLAPGIVMVVSASGVTARSWEVTAIGADYGNIRLEGVRSIPPTPAGEVAPVHLTWLVTGPGEPVSAFVHLVDENGMGVGQYDGPPGGRTRPTNDGHPASS